MYSEARCQYCNSEGQSFRVGRPRLASEKLTMGSSGKRPTAKLKVMAKLGENLYLTTKIYRWLSTRSVAPKPKWQTFLSANAEQHAAWREWWQSPQSARWKALEKPPPE